MKSTYEMLKQSRKENGKRLVRGEIRRPDASEIKKKNLIIFQDDGSLKEVELAHAG
ncbi:hypothetical protein [Marinobacter sp.]|jgi:hypothetical protein|uniref:hypothetical protein n=1 Tax=Marinobacter sp. TaxID=50741 RepID=UPI003B52186A